MLLNMDSSEQALSINDHTMTNKFGSFLLAGPISKYTNIIKGWQSRYLVLDQRMQTLSYYTTEYNFKNNEKRGTVKLTGSKVSLPDDDECTFSIVNEGEKTLEFQARSLAERNRWTSAITRAVNWHGCLSDALEIHQDVEGVRKVAELEGYLCLIVDHIACLELRIKNTSDRERDAAMQVLKKAKHFVDSLRSLILAIQDRMHILEPTMNMGNVQVPTLTSSVDISIQKDIEKLLSQQPVDSFSGNDSDLSEDDPFFDALEHQTSSSLMSDDLVVVQPQLFRSESQSAYSKYDACYDDTGNEEEEDVPVDSSIFTHLLSQVKLGMDLTRVTLPTFILERRSFLEMVADFLAHPDLFLSPTEEATSSKLRMLAVVRWYLSAFHAGRKSVVPKKPYNPILGEVFMCYYDMNTALPENNMSQQKQVDPITGQRLKTNSPVEWASDNDVKLIAEQVSHHPPVSAYYAECASKEIEIEGWIWTKSRFLGISVSVGMVGTTKLRLLKYNEEYCMTFPSAYGRSILAVPWFELGGKVYVECASTGYRSDIDFLTKPFYGGKKHKVSGTISGPDGKHIYSIDGEWNGKITLTEDQGSTSVSSILFDANTIPTMKKVVKPIQAQYDNESRRLWKDVTYHLKHGHVDRATDAKRALEDRQRKDCADRVLAGEKWMPKHFNHSGDNASDGWQYHKPLSNRQRRPHLHRSQ